MSINNNKLLVKKSLNFSIFCFILISKVLEEISFIPIAYKQ